MRVKLLLIASLLLQACGEESPCVEVVGEFCIADSNSCDGRYPAPHQFSDGLVCGPTDAAIGPAIESLCGEAGVACHSTAPGCPGDQPADLDQCSSVAMAYADCGGSRGPIFACGRDACRWFTGGCFPSTYDAVDCPSSDICCHSEWVWDETRAPEPALYFIGAFGRQPWAPGRALDVTIAESPGTPGVHDIDCAGLNDAIGSACNTTFRVDHLPSSGAPGPAGVILVPEAGSARSTMRIIVEVEGDRARVCLEFRLDAYSTLCETAEAVPGGCAVSGNVILTDDGGTLNVGFADGSEISGSF